MPHDNLIPAGRDHRPLPAEYPGPGLAPSYGPDPYAALEPEAGLDWRRYLFAIFRYKWLLALALLLGGGVSFWVWRTAPVLYTAEGNLWVEVPQQRGSGDVAPIRTSGLLQSSAWVQLLRSYSVLDSVVVQQRLYVHPPGEFKAAFSTFGLSDSFAPGTFELRVGSSGEDFVLATDAGVTVEEGRLSEGVGKTLGYEWTPPDGSFPPEAIVPFSVQSPRDAARDLSGRLVTLMPGEGNFLEILLDGQSPAEIASIVNALMDRHVKVAAELKRARLDEVQAILEEQLQYTEAELADAEQELEEFRVTTITLPSERAAPITPGLAETRDPVFANFFDMRIQLDQLRRDRTRLQSVLDDITAAGEVRIEALELIPAAARSSELRRILDDLVDARSNLRALRDRYADDYPPVQDLLVQIGTIERNAIPRVVRGIIDELSAEERDMSGRVEATSMDLEAIPPRTIEEGRLSRRVNITETLYNELRGRVETARLAAASSIPDVRILDRAQIPQEPTQDDRMRLTIMILFGCLGLAMGGAVLLDRTDAKFRYATDVSRDIGLGILGSIPRIRGARGRQAVLNAAQALEAFRELRIHTGFAYGSAGPVTLTISSPAAGEGKSLISSNLAVAFAEVGQRTLLIDGDTRRGDAHRLFGLEQSPGLVDYLKERSGQEIIQKSGHDNLDFIGCGSRGISTPELLASSRMTHFMGTLKRSYDVIIVDSPPLAAGGDALILATLTGNLAVVIRTGATDRQLTMAKLDQLTRLPIRVLGAILNDVDPEDGYHYYYSSYLPGYEPVPVEEDSEEGVQLLSGGGS